MLAGVEDTGNIRKDVKILLKAAKIPQKDMQMQHRGNCKERLVIMNHLHCYISSANMPSKAHIKLNLPAESKVSTKVYQCKYNILCVHTSLICRLHMKQSFTFKRRIKIPLNVGLDLDVHKNTRSKSLVEN